MPCLPCGEKDVMHALPKQVCPSRMPASVDLSINLVVCPVCLCSGTEGVMNTLRNWQWLKLQLPRRVVLAKYASLRNWHKTIEISAFYYTCHLVWDLSSLMTGNMAPSAFCVLSSLWILSLVCDCRLLRVLVLCFYVLSVQCTAKNEWCRTPDHALCSTVVQICAP